MKNPKWNWQDFWRGFAGGFLVMLAVLACLWGIYVAKENTKAIGFAQSMALPFIAIVP